MFDQAEDLPGRWAREAEPLLEDDWRRSAGLSNTTFVATADELAEVELAIEELLAPYVLRKSRSAEVPGGRNVRMLRYVLPESAESGESTDAAEEAGT
jgi:hypothetical protein